jgi:hypothetical protein
MELQRYLIVLGILSLESIAMELHMELQRYLIVLGILSLESIADASLVNHNLPNTLMQSSVPFVSRGCVCSSKYHHVRQ